MSGVDRGGACGASCGADEGRAREAVRRSLWVLLVPALAWVHALFHDPLAAVREGPRAGGDLAAALADLEVLARAPRTAGTSQHEAALAHLEGRLVQAGHEPLRRPFRHLAREYANLVCVSPGDDSTGRVVLMAHHDSVPYGPGASDDGAGTVCALEAFLVLAREGHRNDLVLLLTDGEELDLLGARAFVEGDPLAEGVRAVVNLEALGNAGPAWLFETGPEDGAWVERFARTAPLPIGSSLAEPAYRTLMAHRDTDFSPFARAGVGGFNFAILWGTGANHQPHDTLENLSRASLAHLLDSGLAAARVVANADLSAPPEPEPVFFQVPGLGLMVVSPLASRALSALAVALALVAVLRAGAQAGVRRTAAGLGAGLVALAAALAGALLVARAASVAVGAFGVEGEPVGDARSLRLLAAGAALASAGLFAAVVGRLRQPTAPLLAGWVAVVVALELTHPPAAHAAALPLLVTAAAALAPAATRVPAALFAGAGAPLLLAPLLTTLPQVVAFADTAAVLAAALPAAGLAALAAVPFGPALREHPRTGLVVAAVGAVLLVGRAYGDAAGW